MARRDDVLSTATSQLRAVPGLDLHMHGGDESSPRVNLEIGGRWYEFAATIATRPLATASAVANLLEPHADGAPRRLVCAPRIDAEAAALLRERHIDYVDARGNMHLAPAPPVYVHIERTRSPSPRTYTDARGRLRGGGLHVMFALLARPEAAAATVRELARMAGTTKSTVSTVLERLDREGFLGRARGARQVVRREQLLNRWVESYAQSLRPKWVQGRYRLPDISSAQFETSVSDALANATWAWGGTIAEMKLVDYYAGPDAVIHLLSHAPELPRRLRALPDDEDGNLTIMLTPIPLAFESPVAHVAHPLLVYSELATSVDPRARDAARELRERLMEEV